MTNFIKSDGGRANSSFAFERKDCVVRAIAIAYQKSYNEVHNILKNLGRKNGCGINTIYAMSHLDFIWSKRQIDLHMTVQRFAKEYNKGRYVIRVSGHAIAVIDGIIHDMDNSHMKRHVKYAWKVL